MPANNQNDPKRQDPQRRPMKSDEKQEQIRKPGQGNQGQQKDEPKQPEKNVDEDLDEEEVTGRQPRADE
jgi:hypothetical protein